MFHSVEFSVSTASEKLEVSKYIAYAEMQDGGLSYGVWATHLETLDISCTYVSFLWTVKGHAIFNI